MSLAVELLADISNCLLVSYLSIDHFVYKNIFYVFVLI